MNELPVDLSQPTWLEWRLRRTRDGRPLGMIARLQDRFNALLAPYGITLAYSVRGYDVGRDNRGLRRNWSLLWQMRRASGECRSPWNIGIGGLGEAGSDEAIALAAAVRHTGAVNVYNRLATEIGLFDGIEEQLCGVAGRRLSLWRKEYVLTAETSGACSCDVCWQLAYTRGEPWHAGTGPLRAAKVSAVPEPFEIAPGRTWLVRVDQDGWQTVVFGGGFSAVPDTATAEEAAAAINESIVGATASSEGGYLRIVSNRLGRGSAVQVIAHTIEGPLGFVHETSLVRPFVDLGIEWLSAYLREALRETNERCRGLPTEVIGVFTDELTRRGALPADASELLAMLDEGQHRGVALWDEAAIPRLLAKRQHEYDVEHGRKPFDWLALGETERAVFTEAANHARMRESVAAEAGERSLVGAWIRCIEAGVRPARAQDLGYVPEQWPMEEEC